MENWRDTMQSRRDVLINSINGRYREIERLKAQINALDDASLLDRVELAALNRALEIKEDGPQ